MKSFTDAKFEPSKVTFLRLMHSTDFLYPMKNQMSCLSSKYIDNAMISTKKDDTTQKESNMNI